MTIHAHTHLQVAFILTVRENHRTETAHEDALISKTFSFKFVNSFMALIYLVTRRTGVMAVPTR